MKSHSQNSALTRSNIGSLETLSHYFVNQSTVIGLMLFQIDSYASFAFTGVLANISSHCLIAFPRSERHVFMTRGTF